MKTLVIHPKDYTTDFLSVIYDNKNWYVITTNVSKSHLKNQIKSHDRIILLGHGTELGLIGFEHFIIDSTYVYYYVKNIVYVYGVTLMYFLKNTN